MKSQRDLWQVSLYKAKMLCNNTKCLYQQIVLYQHNVKCKRDIVFEPKVNVTGKSEKANLWLENHEL